MKKLGKTNVMRILDRAKLPYAATAFEPDPEHLDAVTTAAKLGAAPDSVYKTLVLEDGACRLYVAVIPGPESLDLKRAAAAFGLKTCHMLPLRELKPRTGYIHGACSPIGMKKTCPTRIDSRARGRADIYVSAGELGRQIRIEPQLLADFVGASFAELCLSKP